MSESSVMDRSENPYELPRIPCGRCGTEHHIDATTLEEPGRCRECFAFLRRPTREEQDQFTDFYVWNCRHLDMEVD
jgi:hypothetical protein